MESLNLELIFRTAYEFYDELELKQRNPNVVCYTVYANELNDENEFFSEEGIPISLCADKDFDIYYLECFHFKQQLTHSKFLTLKQEFINRYFEITNANKERSGKINKLYIKLRDKRDKHRVAILSEIIDIDVENNDNAQELIHQMLRDTLNDRIIIR